MDAQSGFTGETLFSGLSLAEPPPAPAFAQAEPPRRFEHALPGPIHDGGLCPGGR